MRFLKAIISYDGSRFVGWQVQPNGRSVQEEIEKAILAVTGESIRVTSSGRTDSGVHAIGQVLGMTLKTKLSCQALVRAMNASTPTDVCFHELEEVDENFHAIRSAVRKRYRYLIHDDRIHDVFERHYAWQIHTALNLEKMREAARLLVGTHDFASFQSAGSDRLTTERTVHDLSIEETRRDRFHRINLEIEANGFLYNMVRIIVGTLVEVGREKKPVSWIDEILQSGDRRRAGQTAPPHGLYLLHVEY